MKKLIKKLVMGAALAVAAVPSVVFGACGSDKNTDKKADDQTPEEEIKTPVDDNKDQTQTEVKTEVQEQEGKDAIQTLAQPTAYTFTMKNTHQTKTCAADVQNGRYTITTTWFSDNSQVREMYTKEDDKYYQYVEEPTDGEAGVQWKKYETDQKSYTEAISAYADMVQVAASAAENFDTFHYSAETKAYMGVDVALSNGQADQVVVRFENGKLVALEMTGYLKNGASASNKIDCNCANIGKTTVETPAPADVTTPVQGHLPVAGDKYVISGYEIIYGDNDKSTDEQKQAMKASCDEYLQELKDAVASIEFLANNQVKFYREESPLNYTLDAGWVEAENEKLYRQYSFMIDQDTLRVMSRSSHGAETEYYVWLVFDMNAETPVEDLAKVDATSWDANTAQYQQNMTMSVSANGAAAKVAYQANDHLIYRGAPITDPVYFQLSDNECYQYDIKNGQWYRMKIEENGKEFFESCCTQGETLLPTLAGHFDDFAYADGVYTCASITGVGGNFTNVKVTFNNGSLVKVAYTVTAVDGITYAWEVTNIGSTEITLPTDWSDAPETTDPTDPTDPVVTEHTPTVDDVYEFDVANYQITYAENVTDEEKQAIEANIQAMVVNYQGTTLTFLPNNQLQVYYVTPSGAKTETYTYTVADNKISIVEEPDGYMLIEGNTIKQTIYPGENYTVWGVYNLQA